MGEADEVAAQFLCPREKVVRVLGAVGTAAAIRLLLVDTDATEEDRFAVEEDLLATSLDSAEADSVVERVIAADKVDVVEFRGVWGPELELRDAESRRDLAVLVSLERLLDLQLWDRERDLLAGDSLVEVE